MSSNNITMKQLKVSLPDDIRASLEAASVKSGHSLGEEIRRRLAQTFKEDPLDPQTRELLAAIVRLAGLVKLDQAEDWHSSDRPHEVFAAAVRARLIGYKPRKSTAEAVRDLLGAGLTDRNDPPEAIGRTLERIDARQHSDEHLQAAMRHRMARLTHKVRKQDNEEKPRPRSADTAKAEFMSAGPILSVCVIGLNGSGSPKLSTAQNRMHGKNFADCSRVATMVCISSQPGLRSPIGSPIGLHCYSAKSALKRQSIIPKFCKSMFFPLWEGALCRRWRQSKSTGFIVILLNESLSPSPGAALRTFM
jgi:hypothetical protein